MGFTPCKAEQPIQGLVGVTRHEVTRKGNTGNPFRKSLHIKDVC